MNMISLMAENSTTEHVHYSHIQYIWYLVYKGQTQNNTAVAAKYRNTPRNKRTTDSECLK